MLIYYFSQVPRVFINGKFVGGGSELQQLQAEGKLASMV